MNAGRFTFDDAKGRTWDVTITLLGARRIDNSDFTAIYRDPVSMIEPTEGFFRAMLGAKPALMGALIWALVHPQAEQLGLTGGEEEFLEGIDGAAWSRAKKAFRAAVLDFFHDQKTALSSLVAAIDRAESKQAELLEAEMQGIEEAIEGHMTREIRSATAELRNKLGTPSGSSSPAAA